MKKFNKRDTKRVAWLVCFGVHEIADRGLAASDLFSDLWLRHLAVTLDFGNYVFPVHALIITANRY